MDAWKTENTLTYDNTFGKHTVGALFSTTADHYSKRGWKRLERTCLVKQPICNTWLMPIQLKCLII